MGAEGSQFVRDERGEVASWLIVVAALVAAAALAAGVLSGTVTELAARVSAAAFDGADAGQGGGSDGPGGSADGTGDPDGDGDGDGDGGENPGTDPATESRELTAAQVQRLNELRGEVGTGEDAATQTAQDELLAELTDILGDPTQAQQAFDLILEGASPEQAFAEVTGDWSGVPGGDPAQYGTPELRTILETLGIDLPEGADGVLPDGAEEIVDALPNWLLSQLFAEGQTNSLQFSIFQVGTSRTFLPAGVSADISIGGSLELGNPQLGVGFTQTQSVEITAQMIASAEVAAGKSTIGKAYKWLSRFNAVPGPVQDLLSRSPFLRGAVRGLPFSVAYSQFVGAELAYEATINTNQGIQVDAGNLAALPNLYDPTSFESGNSVLIRGGAIEGSTFATTYKALHIEGTVTDFSGLGFGMTRLENGNFAIYSGPVEILENESFVGIPIAGLTSTHSLTEHDFAYAEIDLSTAEGQAAYHDFVTGGGVPQTDSAGVVTATTEVITYEHSLGAALRLGPWSGETALSNQSSQFTVTNYSDGRQNVNTSFQLGGAAFEVVAPVGSGDVIDYDSSVTTVVFEDVDENYAGALYTAFGESVGITEPHHVQLQFTAADIEDLIVDARSAVIARGQDPADFTGPAWNDLEVNLALAETTHEAIYEIYKHTRTFGNGSTIEELLAIGFSVNGGLDGTIETRPSNP